MTAMHDRISSLGGKTTSLLWLLVLVTVPCLVRSAAAQTFTELYPFNSSGTLADGGWPEAGVARDAAGNLYGATFYGGTGSGCDIYFAGCGTVFKVDTSGTETVLHSFGGAGDGWNPTARVVLDTAGNLYGTTAYGGANGYGTIFKVDAAGNETILHSFAGGRDGANPNAGLVPDVAGNFYGTTQYGGRGCDRHGCGTVFRISAAGVETVLYRFADGADGASPLGGVALDSAGNIFGTTWLGGIHSYGTVFRLDSSGKEKVLHSFSGGSDGANPMAAPVLDAAGNMYGTTSAGGPYFGTVYMVDAAGKESILYRFTGGSDGAYPYSHLLMDASGNLFGTVSQSGVTNGGTVFEFSGDSLTVLYGFLGSSDGATPVGGLISDSAGNLYGTALQAGSYGWGSVFEVQP
ncbi:MAG TPA: choice-of-anchor tandem repeat GloVer-containing protein [Candidatus Sulfotelmatobacter sp.]